MTATNHALTGAIIGLTVHNPALALPLALLSHYLLDALPHFRPNLPDEILLKTKGFKLYLLGEATLCFLIVLTLFLIQPAYWWLGAICAFVAAAPDLISIGRFRRVISDKPAKTNWYSRFAHKIQWFERPIGAVVEIVWFVCAVFILVKII